MSFQATKLPSPGVSGANAYGGDKLNGLFDKLSRMFPYSARIIKEGSTYYGYGYDGTLISSNSDAYTVTLNTLNTIHSTYNKAFLSFSADSFDFNSQSLNILAKSNVVFGGTGMDMTTILNGAITNTGASTTNNIAFFDMTIDANNNRGNCLNLQKVTDMHLQRVKLANSSTNFLLNWSSADRLICDKCFFMEGGKTSGADNIAGGQVRTSNNNRSIFRDCHFQKDISLGGGMLTTGSTGNLLIDGCTFVDNSTNSYAAISIENAQGACSDIDVRNCHTYGRLQGIAIGNAVQSTASILKGSVSGCTTTGGIVLEGVIDGKISNCDIHDSVYGYYLVDCDNVQLSNVKAKNTNILNSSPSTDKGGLYALDVDTLIIDGYIVDDDQVTGTTPNGINASQSGLGVGNLQINNTFLNGPFVTTAALLTRWSRVLMRGGRVTGGTSAISTSNTTQRRFRDVQVVNPVGVISLPFVHSENRIGVGGTASAPNASTVYNASHVDLLITSTGGTGVSITVRDHNNTTIESGLSTLSNYYLPVESDIDFGAFSDAPTVKVVGL